MSVVLLKKLRVHTTCFVLGRINADSHDATNVTLEDVSFRLLIGPMIRKHIFKLAALVLIASIQCGRAQFLGGKDFSGASYDSPHVLNVSHYDPKERQRNGAAYSQHDMRVLKKAGAHGLIARTSKGPLLDEKASDFMAAAAKASMHVGAYHFITAEMPASKQADLFVNRVQKIAKSRGLTGRPILLVADFHNRCSVSSMVTFVSRVQQLTGTRPMIYLENSDTLKKSLREADPKSKAYLASCPYWLALYSHVDDMKSAFSANRPLTPRVMLDIYSTWNDWTLWQYGGVEWNARRGRSIAKHYSFGGFRSPQYFANIDRPMERNVFNGSVRQLNAFWNKFGYVVR